MTHTVSKVSVIGAIVLAAMYLSFVYASQVKASAPSGLPATVATTSIASVSTTASLVFATTTACSARVISTGPAAILIGFSDSQGFVPGGIQGHWQAASTTVAYDSGLYGCSAVRVYSLASQTLTVMESR